MTNFSTQTPASKVSTNSQDAKHELGKILRARRLEHDLMQRNLAQKANLDYTYVSKIGGADRLLQ